MRIVAMSDLHIPRGLQAAMRALRPAEVDLVVLAGDIVENGDTEGFSIFLEQVDGLYGAPVFACFGNRERKPDRAEIIRRFPTVTWLDEQGQILPVKHKSLAIYGSQGVLDRPTRWQMNNVPGILQEYEQKRTAIEEFFVREGPRSDSRLLVTHYATCRETLAGEGEAYWAELGHDFTAFFRKGYVDVSIHGHAHLSKVASAVVGKTRVYNVALPVCRGVTLIEL